MEHLMQNLWLNSIVLLLVSLGEAVFLYGLSREVRKVGEMVARVAEALGQRREQ